MGDGPVDAVFKAIERITGLRVRLKNFQVRNMTPGEDAQGEVLIEVEHEGREHPGAASAPTSWSVARTRSSR